MGKIWIIFFVGLAGLAMLIAGIATSDGPPDYSQPYDVVYVGKAAFYTDAEYSAFKTVMAHPDVQIEEWVTRESPPPAIVEFQARVPHDFEFVYGMQIDEYPETTNNWVGIGLVIAGGSILVLALLLLVFVVPAYED